MNRLFTRSFFILLLLPVCCIAQQGEPSVVNIAGGSGTAGNVRFDWSVGEMCLIGSFNKPNLTLENGFLHPGIERLSGNNNKFFARGDILLLPNPAYAFTEINFLVQQPGVVTMRMVDILGKQVMSKQINYNGVGHIEKLNLNRYPAGVYFIHLLLVPADASQPHRSGAYKLTHLIR